MKTIDKLKEWLSRVPRPIRWVLVTVIGCAFLILGLIMLVTPGPGILFLFLGISVLALEIEWARELHKKGLQGLEKVLAAAKAKFFRKWKDDP
jgi:uncharacterized protein (TIGR02611 family)